MPHGELIASFDLVSRACASTRNHRRHRAVTPHLLRSRVRGDQIGFLNSAAPGWRGSAGPAPEGASGAIPVVQLFRKGCRRYSGRQPGRQPGSVRPLHHGQSDLRRRSTAPGHRHSRCRCCSRAGRHVRHPIPRDANYLCSHLRRNRTRGTYTGSSRFAPADGLQWTSGRMPPSDARPGAPSTVRAGRPCRLVETSKDMASGV
jgi:hypothetical protein